LFISFFHGNKFKEFYQKQRTEDNKQDTNDQKDDEANEQSDFVTPCFVRHGLELYQKVVPTRLLHGPF